jgi:hypothetical protein
MFMVFMFGVCSSCCFVRVVCSTLEDACSEDWSVFGDLMSSICTDDVYFSHCVSNRFRLAAVFLRRAPFVGGV